MKLSEVIKISRPRFWLYEAATFGIIGTLSAHTSLNFLTNSSFWIFFIYFLIPANILIYGINDIFDYETDKLNPKKQSYEALVVPERHRTLWIWIIATNLPFLLFVPHTTPLIISFSVFLFCATFYSAPPIRAKAKPLIDSLFSAGHYVATGVFGYYLAGGTDIPYLGIIAGMMWAIAMHAYSAVPDIDADKDAHLKTIAILCGPRTTIIFCWALYVGSAILIFPILPYASIIGACVYSYFMARSYKLPYNSEALFNVYKYFPTINSAMGAILSIELIARLIL